MFSHLHSTPVAVKIFDHVLGKFRDPETADRPRSVYFTFSLEIQYTGRDFFSFLSFLFFHSAPPPPPENEKNVTHRNARKTRDNVASERKIFLIPITDCERQFRLLETLCHPKYLIGVKELNSSRGMRSTLVSGGNTGGQQYLIEFRNSVYVPGVPSALCKPTFSFLELKQRGEGWRLTPAKSVNHDHLENG